MTLIVALRCNDGVVIAADGRVDFVTTDSEDNEQTVSFPTTKLWPLGRHIVWGAAGEVGTQQLAQAEFEVMNLAVWNQPRDAIQRRVFPKLDAINQSVATKSTEGADLQKRQTHFLFAGFTGGQPWILEKAAGGQEQEHREPPIGIIGSGNAAAYHAFAVLVHLASPAIGVGRTSLLVYRMMQTALSVNAGRLAGFPLQMYIVDQHGARALDDAALAHLDNQLERWQAAEAEAFVRIEPAV